MHVDQAIMTRRSVRGFLPKPVPREIVERIVEVAARAPSGTNIQPWKVYACAGAVRDAIAEETCRAFLTGEPPRDNELDAYPSDLAEHFKARRRKECRSLPVRTPNTCAGSCSISAPGFAAPTRRTSTVS